MIVLAIKGTIFALVSVEEIASESDYVNALLYGLTEDYASLLTSLLTRSQGITVEELEAILFAHESMLERFRKTEIDHLMYANVAESKYVSQENQEKSQENFKYKVNLVQRENFRRDFRGRGRFAR
ncbi:uncharacterized protein DS421_14g460570 [Arachis hypogaea]|nr:uncharacterized protein DS421_14g460570 [Arachis hypogaea]